MKSIQAVGIIQVSWKLKSEMLSESNSILIGRRGVWDSSVCVCATTEQVVICLFAYC